MVVNLTRHLRAFNIILYNSQTLDPSVSYLVEQVSQHFVPIFTSTDGDCLFNAISINLCGSTDTSFKIKLASLLICFEYEDL